MSVLCLFHADKLWSGLCLIHDKFCLFSVFSMSSSVCCLPYPFGQSLFSVLSTRTKSICLCLIHSDKIYLSLSYPLGQSLFALFSYQRGHSVFCLIHADNLTSLPYPRGQNLYVLCLIHSDNLCLFFALSTRIISVCYLPYPRRQSLFVLCLIHTDKIYMFSVLSTRTVSVCSLSYPSG